MWSFRDLPLERKLILIAGVTAGLSLLLACGAFLAHEIGTARGHALAQVRSVAGVVARSSRAAVSFGDERAAARTLEALAAEPPIGLACLVDASGRVLAAWAPEKEGSACREVAWPESHRFEGRHLLLTQPVVLDGERIGALHLRYEMASFRDLLARYAAIAFAVMGASLALAFLLSSRLQRAVSGPVGELVRVARRVSEERNYALRAEKRGEDELGLLVDAINEMLGHIEDRDRALLHHRTRLEEQVAERTRTLFAQNQELRREIQARRDAERLARESEQRFRILAEQASDGILLMDASGVLSFVNPAGRELLGLGEGEGPGLRFGDFLEGEVGDPLPWAELGQGRAVLQERRIRRRDGAVVVTDTSLKMLDDGRIQAILRDVTERKQLEAQLRHAQKMEAVGQLAAGVAHEVNNPMAFVRANLGELMREVAELRQAVRGLAGAEGLEARFDEVDELLRDSVEGVDRVVAIVRDVREFAHRGGDEDLELLRLDELLEGVLRLAGRHLGPATRVRRHTGGPVFVQGSLDQLRQVFLNLIVNASDAVGDAGSIEIRLEAREGRAVVSVVDDGPGIEPGILDRIFDPFFTTKPPGKGTGLGLSISYDIVRRHGGEIQVESEPGRGSVFRVVLPLHPGAAADA